MSQLDDFLSQNKQQEKKITAEQRIIWKQQKDFINLFKETLMHPVHEVMIANCAKLRQHGHFAKMLREKIESKYDYERYIIHSDKKHAIISFFGNYDLLKAVITVEYCEYDYSTRARVEKQLKKTDDPYELTDITEDLLNTLVINIMKELLPAVA